MYENICKMISKSIKLNKQIYTVFCNFSKKTLENSMFFNKLQEIAEKYPDYIEKDPFYNDNFAKNEYDANFLLKDIK